MASPWVCSTCRTRLPSIVSGVRSVSHQAARRQGIGAVQEQYRRDEPGGGVGGSGSGVGSVRGRYSRKELQPDMLRPETVLHRLEEERPAQDRRERERRDTFPLRNDNQSGRYDGRHDGRYGGRYDRRNDGRNGTINPRQAALPPALIHDTDAFINAVTQNDLALAWSLLSNQIAPPLRKIQFHSRMNWLRKALVQPTLHIFRSKCTQEWLKSLQNGTLSNHTLPSPFQIVQLIADLEFGKPVFYRPSIWHLAEGVNDLRLTHPNVDLQLGIEELMKLWRLCHVVAINRNRSNAPVMTTISDWSFLPPSTIFAATATRQEFDGLLQTIVHVGKVDLDDWTKSDYTSAALVTLDLLRTTPCKMGKGKGGVCADLPENNPWVKLIESMLKSAKLSRLPPCIKGRMVEASDELREKYWRLLRRVGMRSDVVEAEKRNPVYRRDLKKDIQSASAAEVAIDTATTTSTFTAEPTSSTSSSQPTSSTTPPTTIPTPEDGKPLPEESKTKSTITFTAPLDNPIVKNFAVQQIYRLGRALDSTDTHQVELIRRSIAAFANSNSLTPTALPIELYEHLIMVLFALKQPKSAVEVWRKFTEDGYIPTVKTYTVLMEGASRAHDVTTMEKFWNAMRHQAKIQPDSHAWSTRVRGLLTAKLPQKGLAALSEMGKEWYTAARNAEYPSAARSSQKGSKSPPLPEPSIQSLLAKYPDAVDGVPRPGLVVMNSAISALAHSYYDSEIPKVLHWGRTFQIEPDLITYNALLNVCMRHSRGEEALSLLKRMQEKGIQADSTTWTVLLTALFQSGFLDGLTHEAQGEKILEFIRSVQGEEEGSSGKRSGGLDVKGYALIIDRLLKVHGNTDSAAEVLRYMVNEAGLKPTAQIYTILMTSYFFPPPSPSSGEARGPDWSAIETLWTQISTPDAKGHTQPLDPIFFDRMIEGYALHHEIIGMRPAMEFLARMSEKGMKPGFGALEAVARMLANRGEWDVLGRLVAEVRKRDPGRKGVLYQKQRAFWEFIVETGILRQEGVERVEDVLEIGNRRRGGGRGHWMD